MREMRTKITCRVNDVPMELEISPHRLLLDVLRDDLGLLSVKEACGVQVCGACTVLLDGEPVSACCTLAIEMRDRDVLTVEGLADGDQLHPLQTAFMEKAALQCGYCTTGFILSAWALLQKEPRCDRATIKHWLHGNICRCTGYAPIVAAVERAAEMLNAEEGRK